MSRTKTIVVRTAARKTKNTGSKKKVDLVPNLSMSLCRMADFKARTVQRRNKRNRNIATGVKKWLADRPEHSVGIPYRVHVKRVRRSNVAR